MFTIEIGLNFPSSHCFWMILLYKVCRTWCQAFLFLFYKIVWIRLEWSVPRMFFSISCKNLLKLVLFCFVFNWKVLTTCSVSLIILGLFQDYSGFLFSCFRFGKLCIFLRIWGILRIFDPQCFKIFWHDPSFDGHNSFSFFCSGLISLSSVVMYVRHHIRSSGHKSYCVPLYR